MRKKAANGTERDVFLETLKQATLDVISDPATSRRDKNVAVANGAKLLAIEHRINPGEESSFFD